MSDLYSNDKVRERSERLVETDVIYCVSSLIYELTQNYDVVSILKIEDDINAINECFDWDEPAERHIDEMDRDDLIGYLEGQDVEHGATDGDEDDDDDDLEANGIEITDRMRNERKPRELLPTTDDLRKMAVTAMREQGSKDFCEEFRIDPDQIEVYEHWIVSSWLQRKLAEKGHATGEVLGLTIWGRPTTGQSISMDSVMLEIANDLENMT
jgi:hypothetical protein